MISGEYTPHVIGEVGTHITELIASFSRATLSNLLAIDLITPRFMGGASLELLTPSIVIHRVDMPFIVRDFYNQAIERNQIFVAYANKLRNKHNYDLIHIQDWFPAIAGIALKSEWQIPLIATFHATQQGRYQGKLSTDFDAQIDLLEQKVSLEAAHIIVCSRFMNQEIHTCFGVPDERIAVIANGIKSSNHKGFSTEDLALLRSRYAPDGQKLLFFIGRIAYEKGPHLLIQAMQEILRIHPHTRLLIAGDNGDKLGPLAYELNIEKAIAFLGHVTDRERDGLYRIVDALMIPSLYEPFGIVALEAMALGCNVIASQVGGLGEVVRHEENGLIISPNDIHSIVRAVNRLFSDPMAAQKRRERALHEINTKYQWDVIAAQTLQVYQSTVCSKP